jgi:hypothetical protein
MKTMNLRIATGIILTVLLLAIAVGPNQLKANDLPANTTFAECTPATRQACYQASVAFFNTCMNDLGDSNFCGNLAWHFRNNCQMGAGCPPMTGNPGCLDPRTRAEIPC